MFVELMAAFRYRVYEAPELKFEALNVFLALGIVNLASCKSLFADKEAIPAECNMNFRGALLHKKEGLYSTLKLHRHIEPGVLRQARNNEHLLCDHGMHGLVIARAIQNLGAKLVLQSVLRLVRVSVSIDEA